MEDLLAVVAEKVIELARQKGVEAEAYLTRGRELSIEVEQGEVENLKEAGETGLGVRVIKEKRIGFAYTSDLSFSAVQGALEDAIRISRFTAPDPGNVLPEQQPGYPVLDIFDATLDSTGLEEKIARARVAEEKARAFDRRVTIIERSGYEEGEVEVLVMNTRGVKANARTNYCGLYLFVVAEEGGSAESGFSLTSARHLADLDPEHAAREAARRAINSLGARVPASEHLPCVMDQYVVTRFLSLLARMVDAGAVQKGKSLLAGKLGQPVASGIFSLVDDATFTRGIVSFPFDGEGVATCRTPVIDGGILQTYLYDSYTAAREGRGSTGHGQRGSFRGLPGVGSSNFMLQPGTAGPEELIAGVERGVYITEVMGMHTANPVSGDFSVGAAGRMIEAGRLSYPVRGMTIAGNLGNFFHDVEAVANDLRFYGGKAAPTIRLKALSIGGE